MSEDIKRKVKVKLIHRDALMPKYHTDGAAAFDLQVMLNRCCDTLMPGHPVVYSTGIALAIPEGFVGIMAIRSGKGINEGLKLSSQVDIIDSDFRGEISLPLYTDRPNGCSIEHGERVAQMVIVPVDQVEFEQVEELPETARGTGGLGHTGKN